MTEIDKIQVTIQSSSANAAGEIRTLAAALGELKKNSATGVAVKNLKGLSDALKAFTPVASNASKINSIATSLSKLSAVGSFASVVNGLNKIPAALKGLESANISGVESKIKGLATALEPLATVQTSKFNSTITSLGKIGKVTESLDDETIGAFTKKIKTLTDALEPLSKKLTTVKEGLSGVNSKTKTTTKSIKDMGSGVNAASLNFDTLTNNLHSVVQAVQKVWDVAKMATETAIEWDGIMARFGRGFGPQAQETYDYIVRLNEALGINVQAFMQHSSIYATMLTGFGVAQKDASKMALGYMELTYDIWAGYNDIYKNFNDAAEAVRSAIAGEVEPIRRAGFTIVEATLEVTAANHGITKSIESMTEAEKSYLRYLTLVDQAYSQNLVGTYAKELGTAEGLLRTLSQQTKSLSQAFGSLFLPILVKVLPYVQAFVELLTDLVHLFAGFFGIEIQEVDWSGYNQGSTAVDGVTDSLTDATKAAKELKNATLGIDELNVISPNTGSNAAGGAGGAGGAAGGFADLDVGSIWDESVFNNVKTQVGGIVDEMKEWLGISEEIDTWSELMDTRFGSILKTVGAIGAVFAGWKIGKTAAGLFKTLKGIKNLGIFKTISAALPKVFTATTSAIAGAMVYITALVGAFITLWKTNEDFRDKIKSIWQELKDIVSGFVEGITSRLAELGITFESVVGFITDIWNGFCEIFAPLFTGALQITVDTFKYVSDWLIAIMDILVGLLTGDWEQMCNGFVNLFSANWTFIIDMLEGSFDMIFGILGGLATFLWETLKNTFSRAWEWIKSWLTNSTTSLKSMWDKVKKGASDAWAGIKYAFSNSGEWFKNVGDKIKNAFSPAFDFVKSKATNAWNNLKNGATNAWNGIKNTFSAVPNWFKDKFTQAWKNVKNVFSTGGKIFTGIKDGIVSAFKTIVNGIIRGLNKVVKVPFDGINKALKKIKDISILGSKPFDWIKTISVPQIPLLANGGLLNSGQMFIAREAGPEMVGTIGNNTAVANNEQIVAGIASGVASANSEQNALLREQNSLLMALLGKDNGVYLDGKRLNSSIERANKERGTSIFGTEVYSY